MDWEQIVGQEKLKKLLAESIAENRVSHAQLFVGKAGYGTLPLALACAKEIFRKENAHSQSKVETLNHVDLHFTFPVYKTKDSGLSQPFQSDFREMILGNPYADIGEWSTLLSSENKQLTIYVDEIEEVLQKFSLKSFEAGSKILVMWYAEKMHNSAANKFLKFLEEPPKNTYIIMVAESADTILPTILSRTQIVEIPRIADDDISKFLLQNRPDLAHNIAEIVFQAQGNWDLANKLIQAQSADSEFEDLFIQWVRDAFQVKKKPEFLKNIVVWARNIATANREKQKRFLDYCAETFRLALLQNYGTTPLVYRKIEESGFRWESFSGFIHGGNIEQILREISEADYHLERNGNAKIIWTDLGIKLSRYLHQKT